MLLFFNCRFHTYSAKSIKGVFRKVIFSTMFQQHQKNHKNFHRSPSPNSQIRLMWYFSKITEKKTRFAFVEDIGSSLLDLEMMISHYNSFFFFQYFGEKLLKKKKLELICIGIERTLTENTIAFAIAFSQRKWSKKGVSNWLLLFIGLYSSNLGGETAEVAELNDSFSSFYPSLRDTDEFQFSDAERQQHYSHSFLSLRIWVPIGKFVLVPMNPYHIFIVAFIFQSSDCVFLLHFLKLNTPSHSFCNFIFVVSSDTVHSRPTLPMMQPGKLHLVFEIEFCGDYLISWVVPIHILFPAGLLDLLK